MLQEIQLFNTLTGTKEVLKPRIPGKVTFYSCGPTVYNFIHIGNLRAALVSDLLFRYLRYVGYEVTYVRNYTDIDDKIIKRANEEGVTMDALTKKYTVEVEKDYAVAGMLEPTHKTLATEHIPEMIQAIEKLIKRGHAYVVEGEVIFEIASFKEYGKLSKKPIEDLIAGARVEIDRKKKNPLDFTLWKPAKPGEPSWESPWGAGRPGWHIECSVMSGKWLGEQIDLHHGGLDLIFPHHENEIAQSEGYTGKAPFVRYWVHNGFVTLSQEKMSKSLGNVFLAREFLKQYGGELARYLFLSVHYKTQLDFSENTLDQAIGGLERLYQAKHEATELASRKTLSPDPRAESMWGSFVSECEATRKKINEAYANDLNTAGAMGELFTLIRLFNRNLKEPRAGSTPAASLAAQELIKIIETQIGEVIGVGRLRAEKALEDLNRIRATRAQAGGSETLTADQIEALIAERQAARKGKDFRRSDEIRDELAAKGVEIKDSPQGTTWKYR